MVAIPLVHLGRATSFKAVSYTHLDVYKRQASRRMSRPLRSVASVLTISMRTSGGTALMDFRLRNQESKIPTGPSCSTTSPIRLRFC